VPSASRNSARLGVLAACGLLLLGAAPGCSTTQEKAERQQAQAKHILDARAKRQRQKHAADGPKTGHNVPKSAHRPEEDGS
jgi:hypothetical protein